MNHDSPDQPDQQPSESNAPPRPVTGQISGRQSKPGRRGLLLLGLGLAAVLVIGLLLSTGGNKQPDSRPKTAATNQAAVIEIDITAEGFSPSVVRVTPGTTVTWVNRDDNPHRIASNPFPDHSDLPGLDSGSDQLLGPGANYSYEFKDTGSFGYHDHLNPTMNGTVEVVEE